MEPRVVCHDSQLDVKVITGRNANKIKRLHVVQKYIQRVDERCESTLADRLTLFPM
jgi:hypothetical protein